MATRKTSDEWARIELEYRDGEDSVREIADRHELSEGAIRKRAKKLGWSRRVTKTTRAAPQRSVVVVEPIVPGPPRDAAQLANDGRDLVARMLAELDVSTSQIGELEDLILDATAGDESDARRNAMMRALSLPSRAATIKTLATALKTLNETSAPLGKKAAQQQKANEVASRFKPIGPPALKAV